VPASVAGGCAAPRSPAIDNYRYGFEDAFTDAVIDRKAQNEEIFTRILDDGDFAGAVKTYLMQKVYERQNRNASV
jgi:type I restriction enzyme R subunit